MEEQNDDIMANWCSNTIHFTGDEKNIKTLTRLFEKTIEVQEKTRLGQILYSLEGVADGYMFDISINETETDSLSITFESKWSPLPDDMLRIAQFLNVDFEYTYDESGMELYGKCIYSDGELRSVELDQEQIDSCKYPCEEPDEDYQEIDYDKLYDLLDSL